MWVSGFFCGVFGWWGEKRGFGEVGSANWGRGGGGYHHVENIYRSERKRVGGCGKWFRKLHKYCKKDTQTTLHYSAK